MLVFETDMIPLDYRIDLDYLVQRRLGRGGSRRPAYPSCWNAEDQIAVGVGPEILGNDRTRNLPFTLHVSGRRGIPPSAMRHIQASISGRDAINDRSSSSYSSSAVGGTM